MQREQPGCSYFLQRLDPDTPISTRLGSLNVMIKAGSSHHDGKAAPMQAAVLLGEERDLRRSGPTFPRKIWKRQCRGKRLDQRYQASNVQHKNLVQTIFREDCHQMTNSSWLLYDVRQTDGPADDAARGGLNTTVKDRRRDTRSCESGLYIAAVQSICQVSITGFQKLGDDRKRKEY